MDKLLAVVLDSRSWNGNDNTGRTTLTVLPLGTGKTLTYIVKDVANAKLLDELAAADQEKQNLVAGQEILEFDRAEENGRIVLKSVKGTGKFAIIKQK